MAHSPARPVFDPVDTSNATRAAPEVESPQLSDSNALARFEFESGRGNEGTKILMVEWEDDERTKDVQGIWQISWEGKNTTVPADESKNGPLHRLYFILGPGVVIPKTVTLTYRPSDSNGSKQTIVWRTLPLPAIFPPELGATAREAGKKGVLHTIWAKKRLQSLQKEIEAEENANAESVGLAMVLQEKEWIEQNFGVQTKPTKISIPNMNFSAGAPLSPSSPRSPGGRMLEKMKGLKIGTAAQDLQRKNGAPVEQNPLSPESGDVAMSSFASIKGTFNPSSLGGSLGAKPAQVPSIRRITAHEPPQSILAQQQHQGNGMASLDAFSTGVAPSSVDGQDEDELFAVPMSARSPDMTKSPFSFAAADTMKYLRGETAK